MTVLQTFEYTWPEGVTPITFPNWILTLTQAEQNEFAPALDRQNAARQQWVDNGLLELVDQVEYRGYRWKDQNTFNTNKPVDPTWYAYWQRWQVETGVIFNSTVIEN